MPRSKYTVAYISGTRADFGIALPVLRLINKTPGLALRVYATGMHLMPKFGLTVKEVKRNFPGVRILPATIRSDNRRGLADYFSELSRLASSEFSRRPPDFVLVLGDRAEMLSVAAVCLYLGIPTGHIHGGELSATVDGQARHAITKLSSLHFPPTAKSAKNIATMGEEAWRISVVGAPGLDSLRHAQLPTRRALFKKLTLPKTARLVLVTLHPISERWRESAKQMRVVLSAAADISGHKVVTYPNADAGGRAMIKEILRHRKNPNFSFFPSLDYFDFLALEREAAVWIGNSSAGMIESSSWPTPVINVGPRQDGRERGDNVIDVPYKKRVILAAVHQALSNKRWRKKMMRLKNPWGDGRAAQRITRIVSKKTPTARLLNKTTVLS